jgi:putative spermidine/putrescine transport system permease protein
MKELRRGPSPVLLIICAILSLIILAPMLIPIAISISDSMFVSFPPTGFTLRWYGQVLADREFRDTFLFSIELALIVTVLTVFLGVPCALGLTRHSFPGRGAVLALILSPLVFPVLVTGVALLQFASSYGSNNSFAHLVIGHTAICLPYLVRTVSAALLLVIPSTEDAARTLGANRFITFRRITLPQIGGGILAGCVFAFITSFDDYAMAMWLADARNFTLPLQVHVFIERSFDPSVAAISALMILFSLGLLLLVERVLGLKMHKVMAN